MQKYFASIIIPNIVRPGLFKLLEKLIKQDVPFVFEIILIPQPRGKLKKSKLPKFDHYKIFEEDFGKGFGYYRQLGVEKARGEVLVWIDDDEQPFNDKWLMNITKPIIEGKEKVVTAGVHIPLGQGYIQDCISWLGLPGGGYPGFKVMWEVDDNGYTNHLCSGNFAIEKKTLQEVGGFNKAQMSGNEDVELSDRLVENDIVIKYQENATVEHEARGTLGGFIKWHIQRGQSIRDLSGQNKAGGGKIKKRLLSSVKIMGKSLPTKYFPGVFFLTGLQYLSQLVGYLGITKANRYD